MTNLAIAITNSSWERQFISALTHPMLDITITRRCVDGVDLQAAVRSFAIDVVVVTDDILRVGEDCVAEIISAGVQFIAITRDTQRWQVFGAETIELNEIEIQPMVTRVLQLIREASCEPVKQVNQGGQVIAVTGFGGASGRTRCAIELSYEFAKLGTTCLVDADVYAPSIAQEVAHLDFTGGLLGLSRQAELRKLSDISLHEFSSELTQNLNFLRGLPSAKRWTDLRLHSLKTMWSYVKQMTAFTVIDCGPIYEALENFTESTAKPSRGIAALSALDIADTVVLTANASDVGITRLLNGYSDFSDALEDKDLTVVIYGATSEKIAHEIRIVIARELGIAAVVCLEQSENYHRVADLITHTVAPEIETARRGRIRKRAA